MKRQNKIGQSRSAPAKVLANSPERDIRDDVSELAYKLWQDRGCPDGSPEEDWFRAEKQLGAGPS